MRKTGKLKKGRSEIRPFYTMHSDWRNFSNEFRTKKAKMAERIISTFQFYFSPHFVRKNSYSHVLHYERIDIIIVYEEIKRKLMENYHHYCFTAKSFNVIFILNGFGRRRKCPKNVFRWKCDIHIMHN